MTGLREGVTAVDFPPDGKQALGGGDPRLVEVVLRE